MNPPIDRENLRDVLIAIVFATALVWAIDGFREVRGQHFRTTTHHLMHPTTSAIRNAQSQRMLMSPHFPPELVGIETRLLRHKLDCLAIFDIVQKGCYPTKIGISDSITLWNLTNQRRVDVYWGDGVGLRAP